MTKKLLAAHHNLTPREIQIANLIEIGKTTKEIADIKGCQQEPSSFIGTDNLRKKLGLKNKKTNLRSYLLSFL
jgi:DNA-binding CsgD family transcriptional regulator